MKSATLMAAALVLVPLSLGAQEEITLTGDRVAIYNLAGTASVVPGSGRDVVVELTRGGGDADELEIETGVVRGREALRVIYPSDQVVYPEMGRRSSTDVRVNGDGTFYDDRGRGSRRVRIRGGGRGLEAYADMVIRVPDGRSVEVYLATGAAEAEGLAGDLKFDLGSGNASVTDIRGSVLVDSGSGRITVDNVQGDEVVIDTGSGSVDVGRIRADNIRIDTGSGSVDGAGLIAGVLNVDTGSGKIELSGIESPDVVCDTGSGRVTLDFDSDVDRLTVDTGSGSIFISLPENAGAAFEVDTGSGSIDFDLPVRIQESSRTYARGDLGDGRGSIHLDTGSGSIRVAGR